MLSLEEWKRRARIEIQRQYGSQKDFVAKTGIGSQSGVSQFLSGKIRLYVHCRAMAESLGLPVPDLVRITDAALALDAANSASLASFADLMEAAAAHLGKFESE